MFDFSKGFVYGLKLVFYWFFIWTSVVVSFICMGDPDVDITDITMILFMLSVVNVLRSSDK